MKRSQQKKITRIAKILRYMRASKRISMRAAGRICNLSDSAICHYEHGRMDISEERITQLVTAYGYTLADFTAFMDGQEIPVISLKEECAALLEIIDNKKLKTVHAVLTGFLS